MRSGPIVKRVVQANPSAAVRHCSWPPLPPRRLKASLERYKGHYF